MSNEALINSYRLKISQQQTYINNQQEIKTKLNTCRTQVESLEDNELSNHLNTVNSYCDSINAVFGGWDWEGQLVQSFEQNELSSLKSALKTYKSNVSGVIGEIDAKLSQIESNISTATSNITNYRNQISYLQNT